MKQFTVYILTGVILFASSLLLGSAGDRMGVPSVAVGEKSPEPAVTVGMTNTMKFTPDTVRIEKGETVLWKNSSLLAHSVTGDPSQSTVEGSARLPDGAEAFDSGMMDPEETYEHTFKKAGTYMYFCIPHEGAKMFGWVIVE